jgi:hypothetical protein
VDLRDEPYTFDGSDKVIDALDTDGLTLFFRVENVHYLSQKCHFSVFAVPADFSHRSEGELKAMNSGKFRIILGTLATRPGTVDLGNIELIYGERTYHPSLIESEVNDEFNPHARVRVTEPVAFGPPQKVQWYDVTFDLNDFDNRKSFSIVMKDVSIDRRPVAIEPVDFVPVKKKVRREYGEAGCMGYQ